MSENKTRQDPGHIQIHDKRGHGHLFPALDPAQARIDGDYIVHIAALGTSKLCRYAGHVLGGTRTWLGKFRPAQTEEDNVWAPVIYSVCQHQVILSHVVEIVAVGLGLPVRRVKTLVKASLVHDGAEGLGFVDLPSPVKRAIAEYSAREDHVLAWLARSVGLDYPFSPLIHSLDKDLWHTEARDLQSGAQVLDPTKSLPLRIIPMAPDRAYKAWCERWQAATTDLPLRSAQDTTWNRTRYVLGIQNMTTGEELHGVWGQGKAGAMVPAMVTPW